MVAEKDTDLFGGDMPDPQNSDTKLILHRLGKIEGQIDFLIADLTTKSTVSDERLKQLEINQAVLTQSHETLMKTVCNDIKDLKYQVKRNDVLSAVVGAVGAWIASILTFLGLTR